MSKIDTATVMVLLGTLHCKARWISGMHGQQKQQASNTQGMQNTAQQLPPVAGLQVHNSCTIAQSSCTPTTSCRNQPSMQITTQAMQYSSRMYQLNSNARWLPRPKPTCGSLSPRRAMTCLQCESSYAAGCPVSRFLPNSWQYAAARAGNTRRHRGGTLGM